MRSSTLSLLLLGVSGAFASAAPPAQSTVDYRVLDQIRGGRVDLAAFPIRPMALAPALAGRPERIWSVNQHQDLVEVFEAPSTGGAPSTSPVLSLHVGWNPVSVAYWSGDGGEDEVLVACRGTYGVTRLSADDGRILGHVTLVPGDLGGAIGNEGHGSMAEPGDLLVDEATNMAFVSCSGADSVLQIDLTTGEVVRRFAHLFGAAGGDADFRCKNPLFMAFRDEGGERTVVVAPLQSGNNTTLVNRAPNIVSNPGEIDAPAAHSWNGQSFVDLPDDDLFEITPWSASQAGSVSAVASGLGAIHFAHGFNPVDGTHWSLVNSLTNGGPANASEPAVRGKFASNLVVRVDDLGGANTILPSVDLEATTPGGGDGVGQPFALAFRADGVGYVAGLLTDNVVEIAASGARLREWSLPEGAIPRGIVTIEVGEADHVLVHCWGTSEVLQYDVSGAGTPTLVRTYEMTPDSTPDTIQRGREIFFDGHRSEPGTISCATCHVEGGADRLAWDLSAIPLQSKGPMVTQTLVGLEKLGPFHWRGERTLEQFNPAFPELLGHDDPVHMGELSDTEMDDFQAFIFSLKNPANPRQNRSRVVDASIVRFDPYVDDTQGLEITGNAVDGEEQYFEEIALASMFRCVDCHTAPTGTSSTRFPIFPQLDTPSQANEKPSALHELWRKDQPLVVLDASASPQREMALLGTGYSHGGVNKDLPTFLEFVIAGSGLSEADAQQMRMNVSEFVNQWDQGLAPASHFAFYVDGASVVDGSAEAHARNYLSYEASSTRENCDVVVIGQTLVGGSLQPRRWWRDPNVTTASVFVCEDPAVPNRATIDFLLAASASGESHLFVGYPPGMGERMGLDRDMDGYTDFAETAAGTDPYDPASPGGTTGVVPALVSGPDVLWVNGAHARLTLETTIPTRVAKIEYTSNHAGAVAEDAFPVEDFTRRHSPILRGLRPATEPTATPLDPEIITDPNAYVVDITLEAIDGTTFVVQDVDVTMPAFIDSTVKEPGTADLLEHQLLSGRTQHYISKSRLRSVGSSGAYFAADFRVEYKQGLPTEFSGNDLADERAVVGHVVIKRAATGDLELVPRSRLVGIPGRSVVTESFVYTGLNGPKTLDTRIPGLDGFLVGTVQSSSSPSASGHNVAVIFGLDPSVSILSGDKVFFAVDAVVEADATEWSQAVSSSSPQAFTVGVTGAGSVNRFRYSQWNFAEGGEATAFPFYEKP